MAWKRRARRALAVACIAGGGSIVACSIYDPSLLLPGDGGPGEDAGPDTGGGDAPNDVDAAPDPCPHAFPPPRPTTEDGNADLDITTALEALNLGVGTVDAGLTQPLGFDIDHTCTCFAYPSGPGPEACKPRVTGTQHCDDESGRDTSGNQLIENFAAVSNGIFNQDQINGRIANGEFSLLIRVRHYDGGANDKQVELDVFISDGTPLDDAGNYPVPKWDGSDVWTLDSASVLGGGGTNVIPNYADLKAYVADHVVVASVDFPLTLGGSGSNIITLELTGSVLAARVVPFRSTFRLDQGMLAGRWPTKKLLAGLNTLHDPLKPNDPNAFVCPGTATYQDIKDGYICKGADVLTDPTAPAPSAQTCDAISIGIGFTTFPAVLGPVQTNPPKESHCDAGPDDCQCRVAASATSTTNTIASTTMTR